MASVGVKEIYEVFKKNFPKINKLVTLTFVLEFNEDVCTWFTLLVVPTKTDPPIRYSTT